MTIEFVELKISNKWWLHPIKWWRRRRAIREMEKYTIVEETIDDDMQDFREWYL
jgi:hypothetical protein